MNKNLYMVFAGIFFASCLALMFAVWYSIHVLYDYRTEYETLEAERNNFTGMIKSLEDRNRTLSQIAGLDIDKNAIQRIECGKRFVTDIELFSVSSSDKFVISIEEL